jgi:hypothetical protein
MQAQAQAMESQARPEGRVNETRAATLLGISKQRLRRLSEISGLGHTDLEHGSAEIVFTYAELYRLCRLAAEARG